MEVLLPEGEHVYELVFYTHEFFRPFELSFFLTEKDEEIERTFYDFLVPFETISILDKKGHQSVGFPGSIFNGILFFAEKSS